MCYGLGRALHGMNCVRPHANETEVNKLLSVFGLTDGTLTQ